MRVDIMRSLRYARPHDHILQRHHCEWDLIFVIFIFHNFCALQLTPRIIHPIQLEFVSTHDTDTNVLSIFDIARGKIQIFHRSELWVKCHRAELFPSRFYFQCIFSILSVVSFSLGLMSSLWRSGFRCLGFISSDLRLKRTRECDCKDSSFIKLTCVFKQIRYKCSIKNIPCSGISALQRVHKKFYKRVRYI